MLRTPSLWRRRRRRPPTWQATRLRGRVLVEHPDPRVREVMASDLREHGYDVLACGGPGDTAVTGPCPLLHGQDCPGVAGADAVVVGRPGEHPFHRVLVERIAAEHPDLPVIGDADLRVVGPLGVEYGRHQRYRLVAAPLVRRLHDLLDAVPGAGRRR